MTYQVNRLAVSRKAPLRKKMKQFPIFNTLNFQSQLNSNSKFNPSTSFNSSTTSFNSNSNSNSNYFTNQKSLDEINTTIYIQTGGVI